MMDCTSSMGEWIEAAQKNLNKIIDSIVEKSQDMCSIRCAFIGYRDYDDVGKSKSHFDMIDFTEDI